MARPRNVIPPVRRRQRRNFVELRVWFGDRWHRVGTLGDAPGDVRERVHAVIAGTTAPALPLAAQPEGLRPSGLFAAFLRSPAAPLDPRDRGTVRRAGILLDGFHGDHPELLTAKRFEAWRDWLCTVTARRGDGARGTVELPVKISGQYIRKLMAWTRRVYTWGSKEGLVPEDVAALLRTVPAPTSSMARATRLRTAADPKLLAKAMTKLGPQTRAMLAVLRASGMRPSECCRMRPGEVHRRGVVAMAGGQSVDLDAAKAKGAWLYLPEFHKLAARGKPRPIVLPRECHAALKPYLKRDPCFTLTVRQLWKELVAACKAAGVPRVTTYQVRHLVGTETARKGGLHAVMQRLGHSNPQTAARYVSVDMDSVFKTI
jgi:integrase